MKWHSVLCFWWQGQSLDLSCDGEVMLVSDLYEE